MFQDREELAASTNLASSVQEALRQSHTLIVICSKNGAKSTLFDLDERLHLLRTVIKTQRFQCPARLLYLPTSV